MPTYDIRLALVSRIRRCFTRMERARDANVRDTITIEPDGYVRALNEFSGNGATAVKIARTAPVTVRAISTGSADPRMVGHVARHPSRRDRRDRRGSLRSERIGYGDERRGTIQTAAERIDFGYSRQEQ